MRQAHRQVAQEPAALGVLRLQHELQGVLVQQPGARRGASGQPADHLDRHPAAVRLLGTRRPHQGGVARALRRPRRPEQLHRRLVVAPNLTVVADHGQDRDQLGRVDLLEPLHPAQVGGGGPVELVEQARLGVRLPAQRGDREPVAGLPQRLVLGDARSDPELGQALHRGAVAEQVGHPPPVELDGAPGPQRLFAFDAVVDLGGPLQMGGGAHEEGS
jgi:hypothetical protein